MKINNKLQGSTCSRSGTNNSGFLWGVMLWNPDLSGNSKVHQLVQICQNEHGTAQMSSSSSSYLTTMACNSLRCWKTSLLQWLSVTTYVRNIRIPEELKCFEVTPAQPTQEVVYFTIVWKVVVIRLIVADHLRGVLNLYVQGLTGWEILVKLTS